MPHHNRFLRNSISWAIRRRPSRLRNGSLVSSASNSFTCSWIRRSVSFFSEVVAPFPTLKVIIITSVVTFNFILIRVQIFRPYCTNLNPSRCFCRDNLHFREEIVVTEWHKNASFLLNAVCINLITNQLSVFRFTEFFASKK